jgi:hypothetical protein
MKILLCSEGVTDHGRDEYRDGEYRHEDGVLQILMRKLAGGVELSFAVRGRADIKKIQLLSRKFERPDILKAIKLAALAQREECKHIAYHRDEDNNGFDAMYRQVHDYFTVAEENGLRCIAIIPTHMTESWLLADAGAFPRRPNHPTLPSRPEEVWGNKDSDTHPKKYLARILQQFHKTASAATFAEIAANIDVEVARIRCPVSFGRFYEDMQAFVRSGGTNQY